MSSTKNQSDQKILRRGSFFFNFRWGGFFKAGDVFCLRRRRCFENAKPRRSAGGAQLNRFLGELEGPIRDPVLARFPRVAAFSSAESGSGEPPDRAQICAMCDDDPVSNFFFSEPILGPPNVDFSRENAKKSVKKVDRARLEAPN